MTCHRIKLSWNTLFKLNSYLPLRFQFRHFRSLVFCLYFGFRQISVIFGVWVFRFQFRHLLFSTDLCFLRHLFFDKFLSLGLRLARHFYIDIVFSLTIGHTFPQTIACSRRSVSGEQCEKPRVPLVTFRHNIKSRISRGLTNYFLNLNFNAFLLPSPHPRKC